ncbi:MAG: PHP domain-containing protein [Firmicutes bacterium]|nr:PHP domain-containing protein [Bacillota bacterium]
MEFLYETHLHTAQSSKCGRSSGAEHVRYYQSIGYTGIFVTDHFFGGNSAVPRELPWNERIDLYRKGFDDAWNEGQKCGLDVFFGWEETFWGDDYLVYGPDPEWMKAHPEMEHWTHREQYEAVREAGGCVVQAHPFRCRDYIQFITLNKDYVDAVEIANAGNRQIEDAAAKRYAERFGFYTTSGSDMHFSGDDPQKKGKVYGVALPRRLTSAKDYARMIINKEPIRLIYPKGRFEITDEDIPLTCYWVDGDDHRRKIEI